MTTQAVISFAGKQFFVSEGDSLTIDKHLPETPKTLTVDDVLLTITDGQVQVGQRKVKGASVSLSIISLKKGPKVTTAIYQAKSRSRRKVGHRQPQAELQVAKITL